MTESSDLHEHPGSEANLPVHTPDTRRTPNIYDPSAGEAAFWTSLNKKDKKQKVQITSILNSKTLAVEDVLGEPLFVSNVLVHPGKFVSEQDGEEITGVRVVLVCTDGRLIGTWSDNVFTCLKRIIEVEGRPPWLPHLVMQFEQELSARKRKFYILITREDIMNTEEIKPSPKPKK